MVEWHDERLRARRELADSWEEGLQTSRRSNRSSGIFSLFRWFKREQEEPPSLAGSVDTLFSTATARSFAFVHPHQYRPFGSADQPEIRIQADPESHTFRSRLRERDRLRRLEKVSLREKYKLYASGTLPRSVDHIHELRDEQFSDFNIFPASHELEDNSTLGRKKRKAPPPPAQSALDDKVVEVAEENRDDSEKHIKQHRRTLSEPFKACHVKGKRKAPQPPASSIDSDVVSIGTNNTSSSKRSRKKRKAPSPPRNRSGDSIDNGIVNIIRRATNDILNEELSASGNESQRDETASNASTLDVGSIDIVCTDTLKLERGILKPNMEKTYAEPKICPSSPVSPRPWYKRATSKDLGSVREKDKDKKKERDRRKVEDWMIESGFPRRSLLNYDNKYNIFSRTDKSDEKRKSQISILTNISELDREAAEIIRRGKEREKHLMESQNAKYYEENRPAEVAEALAEIPENSRKSSARELISLFNAITNVTKTTVNSSVFPQDLSEGPPKENNTNAPHNKYEKIFKNSNINQPIEIESLDEVIRRKLVAKPRSSIADDEKPGTSSASTSSVNSGGKIARVTIEELDEYDAERNSKAQALYETNKHHRQFVPPIPTIKEVSENSAKSSPVETPVDSNNPSDIAANVSPEVKVVEVKQMNVWVCPRCTLENLRWRITCEACDMWRPNPFELREKKVPLDEKRIQENNKITKNNSKNFLYPNAQMLKMISGGIDNTSTSVPTAVTKDPIREMSSTDIGNKSSELLQETNKKRDSRLLQNSIDSRLKDKTKQEKESTKTSATKIAQNESGMSSGITDLPQTKISSTNSFIAAISKDRTSSMPDKESESSKEIDKLISVANDTNQNKFNSDGQKNSDSTSDSMNNEIRKARLAFFDKSVTDKNDESKGSSIEEKEKKITHENINKPEEHKQANQLKQKEKGENIPIEKNEDSFNYHSSKTLLDKTEKVHPNSNATVEVQTSVPKRTETKYVTDDIEKKRLKEMLIEMKHSLPKRPKPFKKTVDNPQVVRSDGQKVSLSHQNENSGSSQSNALPSPAPGSSKPSSSTENNYAEAYLIESETVVEEVKVKKPSEKVSSSVQTSGLVTQISPQVRPSSGKEILIPIRVEEYTDGLLGTSVSKGYKRIGAGAFELMRPRDFANIKEVKTESKAVLPLYANLQDDAQSPETEEVNSSEFIDKLSKQLVKPQGVASFRADLDVSNDKNMKTIAVNRLLKRLEGAIASGSHELAAGLARELAQLKVSCSVVRHKSDESTHEIVLDLYVEDKVSHQGPFHMKVRPTMKVKELRELVELEYEIPVAVQRWIIGNQLAGDETASLASLGVEADGFPVFLYLVLPELNSTRTEEAGKTEVEIAPSKPRSTPDVRVYGGIPQDMEEPRPGPSGLAKPATVEAKVDPTGTLALGWKCEVCTLLNSPTRPGCAACSTRRPDVYQVPEEYRPNETEALRIEKELETEQQSAKAVEEEKARNYQKLVDLEKDDLIIYPEEFECPVCLAEYGKMEGVVLRECLHVFCRSCLANTVQFSEEAEVKCPYRDDNYPCDSTLLEREIKSLVSREVYEEHLAKSMALAETKIGNAFHCKTPDCIGWCIYEDNVNIFKCPVCTHTNCLTCQAVHEGLNCKQYQEQLHSNSDMNIEVKRTKEMLQEMVDRGEAMNCPTCQVVLMKKWGCDWLRCSMCKTEICWITRGPRWGPNGKGDVSGGCQCGVNGIKCHPKCTYCH